MINLFFMALITVAVVEIVLGAKQNKNSIEQGDGTIRQTKKLDKVGHVLNVILSIFYMPLSLFSALSTMASDGLIDATNPVYRTCLTIYCTIAMFVPILCIAGVVLSMILRRKGHSIWALVVQFLPMVVFGLNMALMFIAERFPRTI